MLKKIVLFVSILLWGTNIVFSQRTIKKESFLPLSLIENIEVQVFLPPIDVSSVKQKLKQKSIAGVIRELGISFFEKAEKLNLNGNQIFVLKIVSHSATGISLYFDDFFIPSLDYFFIYNKNKTIIKGAFTSLNNNILSNFATSYIPGDTIILEYVKKSTISNPKMHLAAIGHRVHSSVKSAGDCQIDANCSEGANYQDVKRSVLRVLTTDGYYQYWGSAVLVNNTRMDYTPYVLSAEHLMTNEQGELVDEQYANQFVFYFNFEQPECNGTVSSSSLDNQTLVGASLVAHSGDLGGETGSDMLLLKLNAPVPESYNPYFAGWNNQNLVQTNNFCIHHPSGDVKKISFTNFAVSDSYGETVSDTHWKVKWRQTENGFGTTEPGSSGAPLFNDQKQVIGTLTGGYSGCDYTSDPDWYGKFSYHWLSNGTTVDAQLAEWLAPGNTELQSINGISYGEGNNIQDILDDQLRVMPSVIDQYIMLEFKRSDFPVLNMQIFDVNGKLVMVKMDVKQNQKINLPVLSNGMYFAVFYCAAKRITRKIMINKEL